MEWIAAKETRFDEAPEEFVDGHCDGDFLEEGVGEEKGKREREKEEKKKG